jgi:hypothetical protein
MILLKTVVVVKGKVYAHRVRVGPGPGRHRRHSCNVPVAKGTRLRRMVLSAALAGQGCTRKPEGLVHARRVLLTPTPSRGARRSMTVPVSLVTRLRRMVLNAALAGVGSTRIPQGVIHAQCVRLIP